MPPRCPLPTDVPAGLAGLVDELLAFPEDGGIAGNLTAVLPLVEATLIGDPTAGRPEHWEAGRFQCRLADTEPQATLYMPAEIQPWMSVEFQGSAATGMAMGAIGGAFIVPPP